jgi:hypothetical protein
MNLDLHIRPECVPLRTIPRQPNTAANELDGIVERNH